MINIGSLVGTLEFQDNATGKLRLLDAQLHQTFGAFAIFQEKTNIVGLGLQQFGSHVARTGDQLSMLSVAVVGVGVAVARLATQFQTNMVKIANLTEIGVQGMQQMTEAVLKMGPEVAQGPIALSEALYSIGSVGLKGAQALEVLKVSAEATAVGMGKTADTARAVSAAVINYADQGMTAAKAADILTVAIKEGGAEADKFSTTLGRVIASGKMMGLSFAEVTASVATFTRLGVPAQEAITALRGTIQFLMKPSYGAREALHELGLSMDDVRKSVRERGLAQTLIELVQLAGENDDALAKIIPNVRALAGVLANAGSQAEAYKEILDKVEHSTGALNDAFEIVSETAGFKFQQALVRLQEVGVKLGDILLPALVSIADALAPLMDLMGKLLSIFQKLPAPIQAFAGAWVLLAIAIGPIMSLGGRMIMVWGLVARMWTGLTQIIDGSVLAMWRAAAAAKANATAQATLAKALATTTQAQLALNAAAMVSTKTTGTRTIVTGGRAELISTGTNPKAWAAYTTAMVAGNEANKAFAKSSIAATDAANGVTVAVVKQTPAVEQLTAKVALSRLAWGALRLAMSPITLIVGGIAAAYTTLMYAAGALTGKTEEVHSLFKDLPNVFGNVVTVLKNSVIIQWKIWAEILNAATIALKNFRDTAKEQMPGLFLELSRMLDEQIAKWKMLAALIEWAAQKSTQLAGEHLTVQGILEEAEKRRATAQAAIEKETKATELQKQQLKELTAVWDALNAKGKTFDLVGSDKNKEIIEVLIERFKTLRDAQIKLPERIEQWYILHTALEGDLKGALKPSVSHLTADDMKLVSAHGLDLAAVAAANLSKDVAVLKAQVGQADAILAHLDKKTLSDLTYAINSHVYSTAKLVDQYKNAIGGASMAEIVVKRLTNRLQDAARVTKAQEGWFGNFVNEAAAVENEIKLAREEGTSWAIILDELGPKLDHVSRKSKMWGVVLKDNTQEAIKQRELQLAFQPVQDIQDELDRWNQRFAFAIQSGRTVNDLARSFGSSISTLIEHAKEMPVTMGSSFKLVADRVDQMEIDKILQRYDAELVEFNRQLLKSSATLGDVAELTAAANEWRRSQDAAIALMAPKATQQEINLRQKQQREELQDMTRAYLANMEAIKKSRYAIEDYQRAFAPETLTTGLEDISIEFKRQYENIRLSDMGAQNYFKRLRELSNEEIAKRRQVTEAWLRGGNAIKSELKLLADDAMLRYRLMRESGQFTADAVEEAWQKMIDANIQAQGQWAGSFIEAVASMPDAIAKAFTQMMHQVTTFKEFFVGIWESIKNALFSIFDDIVERFIRQTLQRIIGAMIGGKNATSGGFGNWLNNIVFGGTGGQQSAPSLLNAGMSTVSSWVVPSLAGAGTLGLGAQMPGFSYTPGMIEPPPSAGIPGGIGVQLGGEPSPMLGGAGGLFSGGKTNWGGVAGGGLMALGGAAMWKSAEDSKMGNMMGGAMTGAGIGMMFGGPLGGAIGAGVGAVVGLVSSFMRKPEYKKVMGDIGKDWGVSISSELAKQIAEDASKIEGGTKEQRRKLAEVLNMSSIIEEAGGLTSSNLETFERQAQRLFEPIESGSKEAGRATEELNKVVRLFAAQADKTGGLWDKNFKLIIARALETGQNIEAVTEALNAQSEKIAGGISKIIAGFADPILAALGREEDMGAIDQRNSLLEKEAALVAKINDLEKKGATTEVQKHNLVVWKAQLADVRKQISELDKQLEKDSELFKYLGDKGQEAFDRVARVGWAAFNAIVAAGKSPLEAMDLLSEGIDKLIAVHDKLGLKGSVAYDALARFRNLTKDNREYIETLTGVNDTLVGMANLGMLNQDVFDDLQKISQGAYDKLKAAGFTEKEILTMMKPQLEAIVRLQKEQGLKVDETTQSYIDAARAQGVLADEGMDTNSILIEGFKALITALKGDIPDAWKTTEEKARERVRNIRRDFDELERPRHGRLDIDVNYNDNGGPGNNGGGGDGGSGGDGGNGGNDDDDNRRAFRGGLVTATGIIPFPGYLAAGGAVSNLYPKPKGTDTVRAMLTPGEMVITAEDQRRLLTVIRGQDPRTSNEELARAIMDSIGGDNYTFNISAVDGADVERILRDKIIPQLRRSGSLKVGMRDALRIA